MADKGRMMSARGGWRVGGVGQEGWRIAGRREGGTGLRTVGALFLALVWGAVGAGRAQEASPGERYVQDVEFLLQELEARAGQFFTLKGIDWEAVKREFRRDVTAVTNDTAHAQMCARLLARLRDGHAALRNVQVKAPDEARGRNWTGPRVHLLVVGEKVFVRYASTEAQRRGLALGREVVAIEGVPAREWLTRRVAALRDHTGYSTEQQALYSACHWGLADWSGTRITFEVGEGAERKQVMVVRQGGSNFVPLGPVVPPRPLQAVGRQSYGRTAAGFGYIHLRDVPGDLPAQLDQMLEGIGEVPGMILDLRANGGGGCDHDDVFARFVGAGQKWRRITGAGPRPFAGPLVVIIDAGTRSAGETVASMLKEDGRALVIGETPSAGTSSQKATVPVPSGLFSAYFSIASNMRRSNGGRGLEGIGVIPHEVVAYDPAELRRGVDTLIRRAEEWLKEGLPAERVPYEGRSRGGVRGVGRG